MAPAGRQVGNAQVCNQVRDQRTVNVMAFFWIIFPLSVVALPLIYDLSDMAPAENWAR